MIDVEQVLPRLDFAHAFDLLAIDRGDLGLGQALAEGGLDQFRIVRAGGLCDCGDSGGRADEEARNERDLPSFSLEFHVEPQFLMKVPSRNTTSTCAPVGISTTG